MNIYEAWIEAKEYEKLATERRREIEDELVKKLEINEDLEGVKNFELEGFLIKVTGRMTRKVDAEVLHELGIDTTNIIRWKPELNLTAYRACADNIRAEIDRAITTVPGRPSFSIERSK